MDQEKCTYAVCRIDTFPLDFRAFQGERHADANTIPEMAPSTKREGESPTKMKMNTFLGKFYRPISSSTPKYSAKSEKLEQ